MQISYFFVMFKRYDKILCGLCLGIILLTSIHADEIPQLKEYHIKAKYINGFTAFIKWSVNTLATKEDVLHLCIVGENPFGEALNILVRDHNESVNRQSNPQRVTYLRRGDNFNFCHLLYFSNSEENYTRQILEQLRGKPVLTVSSLENFATSGGMIQFYPRDNKIRFFINLQAVKESKLKPDANLLRVADLLK
jgi:hypothetical protein